MWPRLQRCTDYDDLIIFGQQIANAFHTGDGLAGYIELIRRMGLLFRGRLYGAVNDRKPLNQSEGNRRRICVV